MKAVAGEVERGSGRRRRRLRRALRSGPAAELNLVAMIDVFAVLVFFLLVSASLAAGRLSVLGIELPARGAVAAASAPPRLMVSIVEDALLVEADGITTRLPKVAGRYDIDALTRRLRQAKSAMPHESRLVLLVQAQVPYEHGVAVMDAARGTETGTTELFPRIAVGARS